MIKAILIDPFAIQVRFIKLPHPLVTDQWECLNAMYAALSHGTCPVRTIEAVRLHAEDGVSNFLIVDGDGRVRDDPPARWFYLWHLHHETIAGKGLIIGADDSGNERSTTLALDEIEWRCRFFEVRLEANGTHLVGTRQPWGQR